MKRALYMLGMGLAVSVLLYAGLRLAGIGWGYYENRQALAEASSIYHDARLPEIETAQTAVSAVDAAGKERKERVPLAPFQPLLRVNPEVAGWIKPTSGCTCAVEAVGLKFLQQDGPLRLWVEGFCFLLAIAKSYIQI